MSSKNKEQTVGRPEAEFKFRIGTIIWIIIGFIISWINMLGILNGLVIFGFVILKPMQIWSYLTIIFTTIIPTIIIALKNRLWGYGYLGGFAIAGIPFLFIVDPFIGGYTFATALFIFIILWLIFWRAWRTLSSIKRV